MHYTLLILDVVLELLLDNELVALLLLACTIYTWFYNNCSTCGLNLRTFLLNQLDNSLMLMT